MNIETKKYFIETFSNGDGITITVDKKWALDKKHDFYWNPITNILLIEYIFGNKSKTIKTTCENFGCINIKGIT